MVEDAQSGTRSIVRRAVGILAKAPVAGTVKTRLVPDVPAAAAAHLAAAFLRDAMLASVQVDDCSVTVFIPAGDNCDSVSGLAPQGVKVVQQHVTGLTDVQSQAVESLLECGADSVVLIGADIPDLCADDIVAAFAALESEQTDVVLGPSHDGGYYLVGMREPHVHLFEDIDWSTDRVLAQTLERARERELRTMLLPPRRDVDDIDDLHALIDRLGRDPSIEASATRLAIQVLRGQGVVLPPAPLPWEVTETTLHFKSHWRSFVEESVITHTGDSSGYSYMIAPDAVWVVPITPAGEIVLVRQYRHPVREWVLEVPAGGLDGATPAEAAVKELREEIGGSAPAMEYLGEFFGCSGSTTHRSHYFVAFDVETGDTSRENTEVMEMFSVPVELAFDMAARGEISDGQSALAVMLARDIIRSRFG